MNNKFLTVFSVAAISLSMAAEDPNKTITVNNVTPAPFLLQHIAPQGTIRPLNREPSKGYGASTVQTKLNVDVKDGTNAVRFIRDTNNPFVVTKAYLINNADPFIMRGVLKSICAGMLEDNPVSVESVKYNDGKGVLLVSAEEYRFKDTENGMSIDKIIASLDKKDLPNSSGTIDMAYFPRHVPAETLLVMMKESGIGFTGRAVIDVIKSNSTESNAVTSDANGLNLRQYSYGVADPKMNALILTMPGFDMHEAMRFLKEIDRPLNEIHLTYKLVEIYAENDQKIGLDFQAWKNNDGIDLFSAGGKYGYNNWNNNLIPNLSNINQSYYNFNPKWNTKYIDFLTTYGKANIVSSGKMVIAHGGASQLTLTNDFFKIAIEKIEQSNAAKLLPQKEVILSNGEAKWGIDPNGWYSKRWEELLAAGVMKALSDTTVNRGNTQKTVPAGSHYFNLVLSGDVQRNASNLNIGMYSTSLIGWDGSGTPRLTTSKYTTHIQIGSTTKEFVVGGITKSSVVRSVNGIPWLKDLPVIGWLFSTETDIVKKSQFVLIASAEVLTTDDVISKADKEGTEALTKKVNRSVQKPITTYGFQQLLLDK